MSVSRDVENLCEAALVGHHAPTTATGMRRPWPAL
jgi:hypothetical protein